MLTPRGARSRRGARARVRGQAARAPAGPSGAAEADLRGRAARLSRGDPIRARGRLAGRGRPCRPAGSASRDHRACRRPQDGDQRAQLGCEDLHGRLRGRELPDLGERRRWPAQPDRRDRADDLRRDAGQELCAEGRGRGAPRAGRAAGISPSSTSRWTFGPCPRASSTSASTSRGTRRACSSAEPARTSTSRSSRATSRRGSGTTSSASRRRGRGLDQHVDELPGRARRRRS